MARRCGREYILSCIDMAPCKSPSICRILTRSPFPERRKLIQPWASPPPPPTSTVSPSPALTAFPFTNVLYTDYRTGLRLPQPHRPGSDDPAVQVLRGARQGACRLAAVPRPHCREGPVSAYPQGEPPRASVHGTLQYSIRTCSVLSQCTTLEHARNVLHVSSLDHRTR